jgi:hypothetical protein
MGRTEVDEALAVAAHPELEGAERERLLRALSELASEMGGERAAAQPWVGAAGPQVEALGVKWPPSARLGEADEQFVRRLRGGLASLARSLPAEPAVDVAGVRRALEGAEFVTRREIRRGRAAGLPKLLPTFAYLVSLPLLGQAGALRVSKRATRLLDGAIG